MKNKCFGLAFILIFVSTLMLFGQFRTEAPKDGLQQMQTVEVVWVFADDMTTAYQGGCFTICTTDCICKLCCPNGSGGYNCVPTNPPPWCNPA